MSGAPGHPSIEARRPRFAGKFTRPVSPEGSTTRLLLFDLYSTGHHPRYLDHLVRHWRAEGLAGRLVVALPNAFARAHPALAEQWEHGGGGVSATWLEGIPERRPGSSLGLVAHDLRVHGPQLRLAVERLRPSHCLHLYVDHAQLSLATRLRLGRPLVLAGLYFRPAGDDAARGLGPRVRRLRKEAILRLAARNPHVETLFCLDPYAVTALRRLLPSVQVVAVPDPVEQHEGSPARRGSGGPGHGRLVVTLFGVLDERKGAHRLLDAAAALPPQAITRLAFVLAGPVPAAQRERLQVGLARARRAGASVALDDRYLSEAEAFALLRESDVAAVLYQRHLGSSNVLVHAAAASVPVLACRQGVVGEHVRRHSLGQTVDATSTEAVAAALARIAEEGAPRGFDAQLARAFARANTPAAFAGTIFRGLGLAG